MFKYSQKPVVKTKQKYRKLYIAIGFLFILTSCGGGGSGEGEGPVTSKTPLSRTVGNPAWWLTTTRFTHYQPLILEQIGAHYAYGRGLSGRGIKIGIDDSIVDHSQRNEFEDRVKLRAEDGASLSYRHPFGDSRFSDIRTCVRNRTCRLYRGDSQGDWDEYNRWVLILVGRTGWPTRDDSMFVLDEHYSIRDSIGRLFRWREVPTPYGWHGSHGTAVASIAAGTHLGVAPTASIIPIARNLTDDQRANAEEERRLRRWIENLPTFSRESLDDLEARNTRQNYAKFDIVNRSFGIRASRLAIIDSFDSANWYRRYLPRTQEALWQTGTPDAEKTIFVHAAGNKSLQYPDLGGSLPYGFPQLRGHTVAVVATDPRTGRIASYSNRCGRLPRNWNAARHGRHYCLAAPGTARVLVPNPDRLGQGDFRSLRGTSAAAPVVSGSLALMMEHFRGTRGNTEVLRRLIDTADRSGRYSDLATYGAGHIDLKAALSPVGVLGAGQFSSRLSQTALQTPAAFGSMALQVANIELAAFDEQNFPFWVPLSTLISEGAARRSPIPRFPEIVKPSAPAVGLNALNLEWTEIEVGGNVMSPHDQEWVVGFNSTSASLARVSSTDGWGYGFAIEEDAHLGLKMSGAFGADLQSALVWASRSSEHDLGYGWSLNFKGTLALSAPRYAKGAMFRATPSVLSAASVRVGTRTTGIVLEQPLRAETGTGTFLIENGRIENGRRLRDQHRVSLSPASREIRMTLRHEQSVLGGMLAIELGGALNSGHVPGEREALAGFAYHVHW